MKELNVLLIGIVSMWAGGKYIIVLRPLYECLLHAVICEAFAHSSTCFQWENLSQCVSLKAASYDRLASLPQMIGNHSCSGDWKRPNATEAMSLLYLPPKWRNRSPSVWLKAAKCELVECCFTSTETVGLLRTGAHDGHLDFHTAPELWKPNARWRWIDA